MKTCTFFIGLLFLTACLNAQNKHDYIWTLGYGFGQENHGGGTLIDFNSGDLEYSWFALPPLFGFNLPCCISDENGALQFYTNGCQIYNADHELIENGDELATPGIFHSYQCGDTSYYNAYDAYQDMLILPRPEKPGRYVYFHPRIEMDIAHRSTLITEIDMNLNGGKGKVISKNKVLRGPVLYEGTYFAIRHGNGRDWWVIIPEDYVNKYNAWLLTPDTLMGPFHQNWEHGASNYKKRGWAGSFSPDGTRFARTTLNWPDSSAIFLFDFDRCSGMLCNPKRIPIHGDYVYAPWVEFSPNSRYLYLQFEQSELYQYDLWADDIEASAIRVGVYDGFRDEDGFYGAFHAMALAPNNKIYMSTTGGIRYYHTIHAPNERGLACDFRQHDLELPTVTYDLMPHFPNFRLYDVPGSYCDTLGIDSPFPTSEPPPVSETAFRLYPNPSSAMVNILLYAADVGQLRVFNALGQLMYQHEISGAISTVCFSVEHWPSGTYMAEVTQPGQKRLVKKLVVMHLGE